MQTLKTQPLIYLQALKPVDTKVYFNNNSGSITQLEKGGVNTKALIIYLVAELVEVFNFGKTMSASQIGNCADSIIFLYPHYFIEDFKLCFFNIKQMKYGKLYESVDEAKILSFLAEFDVERVGTIESIRLRENSQFKQDLKSPIFGEEIAKKLSHLIKPTIESSTQKERVKTDAEILLGELIKEFDTLFSAQDKGLSGQRFVFYSGVNLNIDQYCNLRMKELTK